MTIVVVTMGVVVAVLLVLVVGLLRSHADILRALHALGVTEDDLAGREPEQRLRTQPGVPTPRASVGDEQAFDIAGATPTGGAARVAVMGVEHTTLVAFLSSGCLTCRDFWDAFRSPVALPGHDTRLVVVTRGPEDESPPAVAALAPPGVTVVMSSQAWDDYGVPVSPYFVLVDGPSGEVVGEGAAASWDKVVGLLGRALDDTSSPGASTSGASSTGASTATARNTSPTRTSMATGSGRGHAGREADTDEVLRAAGIVPDDPRLHHPPTTGGTA